MRRILAAAAVVAAMSFAAVPARAALLWQETFAPDPSGQTSVPPVGFLDLNFPLAAPSTSAFLTVRGGALALVDWTSGSLYDVYDWEQFGPDLVLTVDELPDFGAVTIDTKPTVSSFRFDANSYFNCDGAGEPVIGICGVVFSSGAGSLEGVLVNATQPFTLAVYTGVPEPSTWAMMLGGFTLLGVALRGRRDGVRLARS